MTVSRSPVGFPRISARVRILLWLLVVMAVALGAVAVTVRSILQRDVDHRISQLLTQETGEFANFVPQGVDPGHRRPVRHRRPAAAHLSATPVRGPRRRSCWA
ncbi:hypothetical protein GA0115255_127061, partial [Streptomyces sp. Ncost-T6T-2b]